MTLQTLLDANRNDLRVLTGLAHRDLERLWAKVQGGTPQQVRNRMIAALPRLVDRYGAAAATLAADQYDDLRASQGVTGRFAAVPVAPASREQVESLVRWGVAPLFRSDPATALSKIGGGVQRLTGNAHRDTTIYSTQRDPKAAGWSRSTSGGCDFCKMLAGRGAIYSADSADFASHDHCHCTAYPAFGDSVAVKSYEPSQRFRTQSARDAHNARTRAGMRVQKLENPQIYRAP